MNWVVIVMRTSPLLNQEIVSDAIGPFNSWDDAILWAEHELEHNWILISMKDPDNYDINR